MPWPPTPADRPSAGGGQNGGVSWTGARVRDDGLRRAGHRRWCTGGGEARARGAARGGSRARSTERRTSAGPSVVPLEVTSAVGSCRSTVASRAFRGAVVRTAPTGSVHVAVPSGSSRSDPSRGLLDPMVAPAEAEKVRGSGGAGRPGPHVVEVAEPRRHGAPREPAPPVAGSDQLPPARLRAGTRWSRGHPRGRGAPRCAGRTARAARLPDAGGGGRRPLGAGPFLARLLERRPGGRSARHAARTSARTGGRPAPR